MRETALLRLSTLLLFVSFTLVACGGGNSPSESTTTITLDSSSEGGSTTSTAILLSDTPIGGTPAKTTGIVLLHGRGGNPDSAVVKELRKDLYNRGYMTLSIQAAFPVAGTSFQNYIDDVSGPNFTFPETYARIRTAINALASRGATEIVVIGFSMGSRMMSAHVARGQINELPIVGFIGIGMYANSIDPLNVGLTLDEITVPVLDIYGHVDTTAVTTAATRMAAYGGAALDYSQVVLTCPAGVIDNDCHQLNGLKGTSNSPLETEVFDWIKNL